MLAEKMHVMGLPNRETGLSMGRKHSVFLVLLDYDKYFGFQGHWKLARGPSHFCFIKMFRWFYSKPQANIIQGWGWGGEVVLQHYTHLVAWGSKYKSQGYIFFVTCQPRLKASTKRIFSLFQLAARIDCHEPEYWWEPRLPVFFLTTSCLCRREKPFY